MFESHHTAYAVLPCLSISFKLSPGMKYWRLDHQVRVCFFFLSVCCSLCFLSVFLRWIWWTTVFRIICYNFNDHYRVRWNEEENECVTEITIQWIRMHHHENAHTNTNTPRHQHSPPHWTLDSRIQYFRTERSAS